MSSPATSPALESPLSSRALEKALTRDLERVTVLILRGDVMPAHRLLDESLRSISTLPRSRYARELRARAKVERARMGWYAAGVDTSSTLQGALELAAEARREMGEIPPPEVRAGVASMIAGIACDLGDGLSIERGLAIVTECTKALLAEGATVAAGRLLVDRAALELRGGDRHGVSMHLERAVELLEENANDAPGNVVAQLHLARARHLLARLPLHGNVAGGTRAESLTTALAYCQLAEATYAQFGQRHELVRVLDTTARLEALRGRHAEAHVVFERALIIADDIADLIGLARATAGLAEVVATMGDPMQAMTLAATSIRLNREKGSRIGLAADEMAVMRIDDALTAAPPNDASATAALDLHTHLADAIKDSEE